MAGSGSAPAPAPWRAAFVDDVASMKQATFVLATVRGAAPRARTCIFRGMWCSLPANDRNPAPRNPALYESDLPVFTTDVRMDKVEDILGGGPVEAVWWAEARGTQWRVRGTAWVLGPDVEEDGGKAAREMLRGRMRLREAEGGSVKGTAPAGEWSWAREITAHFGNLSPVMRGTFRNPSPGRPIAEPVPPESGLGLSQTVEDLHDQVARANFRVVVIMPDEVEQVDLSDMKNPRRLLYSLRQAPEEDKLGRWEAVELWP